MSHYSIERFPIQPKTRGSGLDPDVGRPLCIVEDWNLAEHFTLPNGFNIDILPLWSSITIELTLVHNKDLITLIALADNDFVLLKRVLRHRRDQLWGVLVVEVFK